MEIVPKKLGLSPWDGYFSHKTKHGSFDFLYRYLYHTNALNSNWSSWDQIFSLSFNLFLNKTCRSPDRGKIFPQTWKRNFRKLDKEISANLTKKFLQTWQRNFHKLYKEISANLIKKFPQTWQRNFSKLDKEILRNGIKTGSKSQN